MTRIRRSVLARLVILAYCSTGCSFGRAGLGGLDIDGICGKRYIAAGDHVPAGHEVSTSERFPSQLREDHLAAFGYCSMNIAVERDHIGHLHQRRPAVADMEPPARPHHPDGGRGEHDHRQPDQLVLRQGQGPRLHRGERLRATDPRQQLAVDVVDQQPDHDPAAVPADHVGPAPAGGRGDRIFEPVSRRARRDAQIVELCVPLIDNIAPCTIRWAQFPPALVTIDQVFKKLNTTIQNALKPFQQGPSANRYVFVDTYTKTRDHCMKMDVQMKTTVEHPELEGQVHHHDNFRRSASAATIHGTSKARTDKDPQVPRPVDARRPDRQEPDDQGDGRPPGQGRRECVADLIWEADTIDPERRHSSGSWATRGF